MQKLNIFKNSKPVIAIDGTAGSGKGTLAKKISKELDFDHLDTGLLYRIYAYETIHKKNEKVSERDINKWLKKKNGTNVLRSEEVSRITSIISQKPEVRKLLINLQRNFANNPPKTRGSVIDGRDIGTIIIPNAEIKFFVDAKLEIRASRRINQLELDSSEYDDTIKNMQKRDAQDSDRKISPLRQASDSLKIDTSYLSEEEVFNVAIDYIKKRSDFI